MMDPCHWSWSRTSADGRWRLSSISVYEEKIYETWELTEKGKDTKADSTTHNQGRGMRMPHKWFKRAKGLLRRAKGLLKRAQEDKNAKNQLVKKRQAGTITKSM